MDHSTPMLMLITIIAQSILLFGFAASSWFAQRREDALTARITELDVKLLIAEGHRHQLALELAAAVRAPGYKPSEIASLQISRALREDRTARTR
jgi:integrase